MAVGTMIPLVLLFLVGQLQLELVRGAGLGENLFWSQGQLLDKDYGHLDPKDLNLIFKMDTPEDEQKADDALHSYKQLIHSYHVDEVRPQRDLLRLMNRISSKMRSDYLLGTSRAFDGLRVEMVHKPMLLTYLAVRLIESEQLKQMAGTMWASEKASRSCNSLLETRNSAYNEMAFKISSSRSSPTTNKIVTDAKDYARHRNLHRLAYLVYRDNLNLFMLETYLLLCSRLHLAPNVQIETMI